MSDETKEHGSGKQRGGNIVLASRNRKKSAEISELLSPHGITVTSVAEFKDVPDIIEDGSTFAENAAKKAGETAKIISRWTLGEDSGLMVDALGGAPGIFSARFAGEDADDELNNVKLITELTDVAEHKRSAHYVCHVALADPNGTIRLRVEATCAGRITTEARGTNGFGYDPFFLIPEYHRTFGELSPAVKACLSHRARAFAIFVPQLVALFEAES